MAIEDKPYCRGVNAIFRKLPDDKAECVIDFRDPSLLPSVLFHLNGEYHDSQMFIRENLDLLREQLAAKDAEIERLRAACEYVLRAVDEDCVTLLSGTARGKILSALAATARGEGE